MTDIAKRNLIAQWAFDTRPVLLRFHLWLEDVEVERAQAEPVSAHTFTPRGIARCLAMTSAATALGTRLFGEYGGGAGKDKATVNQVKKAADAISAYVMSEGLWHLTRTPAREPRASWSRLGEGLMPKAGETPEMGANPLLGFGRVYARPEVAQHRRSARAPPAQRAGPHLRAVLRVAAGPRHHAVGRRRRHAGEHLALRRGQAHRADGGASTSSTRRCGCRARTSRTWAA